MVIDKAIDLSPVEAIKAFFTKTTLGKFNLTLQIFKMCECNIISNNKLTMTFERLVYISNHSAEAEKPRRRVGIADRKVFARPESFCAYNIVPSQNMA